MFGPLELRYSSQINVGQDLDDRGPHVEDALGLPWVVMKRPASHPSPPGFTALVLSRAQSDGWWMSPACWRSHKKNKQTDGRSRINGGSGAGRLPRALTLIKQRPSQGKGPLEIDCIDFIAFAGKRRGGNHLPPITLLYVCPGRHFSICQAILSETMSETPKNYQLSVSTKTGPQARSWKVKCFK